MATKKPQKKPYNPLASPYQTQSQFDKAVTRTANQQIQPQLNTLNTLQNRAGSAHTNRNAEMGGWYQAASDAARAGAGDLAGANQKLLDSLAGYGQDVQGGMAAAIRAQQQASQAEATRIGGTSRAVDPNMLTALAGYGGANNIGLGSDVAAANTRANANIGIMGTMATRAAEAEQRRYQGQLNEYGDQRQQLTAQLPGLMEQARQNLTTTELGRAGQAFQQDLARDQFGLQSRAQTDAEKNSARTRSSSRAQDQLAQDTFGEQKRAQRVSERQRDTELGISQQNADTQRAQIVASGGTDQDLAKAKGQQFDAGLNILSSAWKQTKNDIIYKKKDGFETKEIDVKKTQARIEARMRGKFDETLRTIMASTGMGEGTALRVMMAAPNHGWAKHARQRLDQLKKARKAEEYGTPTEGDAPGGNEGGGPMNTAKKKPKKK